MNTRKSKLHPNLTGFDYETDYDEPQACSSPNMQSSPSPTNPSSPISEPAAIEFELLGDFAEDDSDDLYQPGPATPRRRASPLTNVQKAIKVLELMKQMNDFSLRAFLATMFTSDDPRITNTSHKFVLSGQFLRIMDLWWIEGGEFRHQGMCDWIMEKAATICSKEASYLAEKSSDGPYEEESRSLRVSSCNVTVQMVSDFRLANLSTMYARVLPQLQKILHAVITKKEDSSKAGHNRSRDPLAGKTLVTSTLLNLRSRRLNFHAAMNSLIFWDNRVSKRLTQAFNQFGVTSSSTFQALAVAALSKSALAAARAAANDPRKIKMVPYDNFNWLTSGMKCRTVSALETPDLCME